MSGIETRGYYTLDEVLGLPGCPSLEQLEGRRLAVIERGQALPCNPCETGCLTGALSIGDPITNVPVLNVDACDGCGNCMIDCPGLAIFVVDMSRDDGRAEVWMPHEFLPLPKVGNTVGLRGRSGALVGEGTILKVRRTKRLNRTAIVHVEMDRELAMQARAIQVRREREP
jgi:Fe-S-cluster-containing hydrogenase component 2